MLTCRLCDEHDVRPSVCHVGGLQSHSAIKCGNGHTTGEFGVFAAFTLKWTRIVVSCDREFY